MGCEWSQVFLLDFRIDNNSRLDEVLICLGAEKCVVLVHHRLNPFRIVYNSALDQPCTLAFWLISPRHNVVFLSVRLPYIRGCITMFLTCVNSGARLEVG